VYTDHKMAEFEAQSICYQDFGALTKVTMKGNFIIRFWGSHEGSYERNFIIRFWGSHEGVAMKGNFIIRFWGSHEGCYERKFHY
jgi:hypothetical protein